MSMNIPERKNKKACIVKIDQRQDVSINAMVAAAVMRNPPVPTYQDLTSLPNPGIETMVTLGELKSVINNQLEKLGLDSLKDVPLNELENKILTAVDKKLKDAYTKKLNPGGPPRGQSEQGGKEKAAPKEKANGQEKETAKGDS